MRFLILPAILALGAAPAAEAAQSVQSCRAEAPRLAASRALPPTADLRAQLLDRLPDAMAIRAVIRSAGGCRYLDVLRERASAPDAPRAGRGWVLAPESRVAPAAGKN
jgi:hypothetical protein